MSERGELAIASALEQIASDVDGKSIVEALLAIAKALDGVAAVLRDEQARGSVDAIGSSTVGFGNGDGGF